MTTTKKGTNMSVELSFTETTVPEQITTKRVNPYLAHVKDLAENRTKALTFTVPVTDGHPAVKVVESVLRDWYEAGKEVGVTVRKKIADDGVTITVWAVDRITRKPSAKNGETNTETAPAETGDAVTGEADGSPETPAAPAKGSKK